MTYEEAIEEMENIYQNGFDNDFDNDDIEKPLDAIRIAIRALEYVGDMIEFSIITDDDFYGEVLCRKLLKYDFLKLENDFYEEAE